MSEKIEVKGNRIIIPGDLKNGVYSFPFMGREFIVMKTKKYIEVWEVIGFG